MKPLAVPQTLAELEATLGPELTEIAQHHRAELARREPYRPVVVIAPVVVPPTFCIRASGRARRPGSRRTHSTVGARTSGSDDDGGGEGSSDPAVVAVAAVAAPSRNLSTPIKTNTGRQPVCLQEIAR